MIIPAMRNPTIEGILNLWRTNTTRAEVPKIMKSGFKNSNSIMPSLLYDNDLYWLNLIPAGMNSRS
jgi:hypothetical protein